MCNSSERESAHLTVGNKRRKRMDTKEAKEIVAMLANGIDSTTGEFFPPDSHYHDPYVIRPLFTILGAVRMPAKASKKASEEKQKDNLERKTQKCRTSMDRRTTTRNFVVV